MSKSNFKFIYGPVSSWRLGRSLGIDLLSGEEKICTFDCIYCQLGKTLTFTNKRKTFVKTSEIIGELKKLPHLKIDCVTFSGRGEPTLAENLGEVIKAVRKLQKAPIAVLTNSSLMDRLDVRKELFLADLVVAKLDAYCQESLENINQPMKGIKFETILQGIKEFKKDFKGKLALQIMFVKENKEDADKLARLTREIEPDEIQINTPTRLCKVEPLSSKEIAKIKEYFIDLDFISVYDAKPKTVIPLSKEDTIKRRGRVKC